MDDLVFLSFGRIRWRMGKFDSPHLAALREVGVLLQLRNYCEESPSFCRFESALCACTTVTGACNVKFSTVSDGSLICCALVAACTPPPTPAPAAAPIAAPLPPPARAPMMLPTTAPPPTFSAVLFPRELPFLVY